MSRFTYQGIFATVRGIAPRASVSVTEQYAEPAERKPWWKFWRRARPGRGPRVIVWVRGVQCCREEITQALLDICAVGVELQVRFS